MPENLIEVWFRVHKDADRFPEHRDWEGLKCSPQGGNVYEVRSVPFYLKEVAYGDRIVADKNEKGWLEFKSIASRGGYSVFRLWLRREDESPLVVVKELVDLGFLVEFERRLIAFAVPPEKNLDEVDSYICGGVECDRWGEQDGFVFEHKK
ncbi:MAG TPA: DUF4265 domain-containing protein [Terriglobia bacterium]|nr:DUF4265 domain-containing protein [Terriglobia bacterium]